MGAPRYQDLRAAEVGLLASTDGGAIVRVIAGSLAGHTGPGDTYTPITLLHATLSPGATLDLPWDPSYNALAYVLAGSGSVGAEARPIEMGQLAVFGAGDGLRVAPRRSRLLERQSSRCSCSAVVRSVNPSHGTDPFVMNTRDELLTAFEDFQAGRLGSVPAVHHTPDHIEEASPTSER